MMTTEQTNEDFGREDRNFHPEEQRINWETSDHAINELQQSGSGISDQTDRENYYNPQNNNRKEQDIEPELDKDLDDALEEEVKDYSDEDFDKKDKSDS